jgi:hypothetical protein
MFSLEEVMKSAVVTEVKRVRGKKPGAEPPRDPSLTGGEKMETRQEKRRRQESARRPKEAPIIQKDVT